MPGSFNLVWGSSSVAPGGAPGRGRRASPGTPPAVWSWGRGGAWGGVVSAPGRYPAVHPAPGMVSAPGWGRARYLPGGPGHSFRVLGEGRIWNRGTLKQTQHGCHTRGGLGRARERRSAQAAGLVAEGGGPRSHTLPPCVLCPQGLGTASGQKGGGVPQSTHSTMEPDPDLAGAGVLIARGEAGPPRGPRRPATNQRRPGDHSIVLKVLSYLQLRGFTLKS